MSSTFHFKLKQGPAQTQFRGQYQLQRYTTCERIVIVWRSVVYSSEYDPSSQLRLHGQGWVVIKSVNANPESPPCTSIQLVARYHPETVNLASDAASGNADMRVLIDFTTCAMESYGCLPTHVAILD